MFSQYSLAVSKEKIYSDLGRKSFVCDFKPNYNISPGNKSYVITNDRQGEIQSFEWGLVPHWSKTDERRAVLYTVKAEGISSKPSYRIPIRQRRCLILADSFYLWQKSGSSLQAYRVLPRDGAVISFAGLWDVWTDGNKLIHSYTIINTNANKEVFQIHNRMPLMLQSEFERDVWLNSESLVNSLELLKPAQSGTMRLYRITDRIKNPEYNTIDIHSRLPEAKTLFDIH